jgi:hypothetical protein
MYRKLGCRGVAKGREGAREWLEERHKSGNLNQHLKIISHIIVIINK